VSGGREFLTVKIFSFFRNARERIDDVPCPLPDDLFNEETFGEASTLSLTDKGHHRL